MATPTSAVKIFASPGAPLLLRTLVLSDLQLVAGDTLDVRILHVIVHPAQVLLHRWTMPTVAGRLDWLHEDEEPERSRQMFEAAHDVVRELATNTLQYDVFAPTLAAYEPLQPWAMITLQEVGRHALSVLLSDTGRPSLRRVADLTRDVTLVRYIEFLEKIRVTAVADASV